MNIWKSTFLIPHDSAEKSKLIHFENINLYPTWTILNPGQTIFFTLIFTGLPKTCKTFDLIEQIPEPDEFVVKNIQRNETDVYFVRLE